MILNAKELANLIHLPIGEIRLPKLNKAEEKTKLIEKNDADENYILGVNAHQDVSQRISLSSEIRLRHIHLIGATGSGKSNLMKNLIVQDMNNRIPDNDTVLQVP